MHIITAKRMISGDVLKYRNGLFVLKRYESILGRSSKFYLTAPPDEMVRLLMLSGEQLNAFSVGTERYECDI